MNKQVFIYGLCEPGKFWDVRYIGATESTLARRLSRHLSPSALTRPSKKASWLNSLVENQQRPLIKLLDIGDNTSWETLEQFYIASYRKNGFCLLNAAAGGHLNPGFKHSTSWREQTAQRMKGNQHAVAAMRSETYKTNMSNLKRDRKLPTNTSGFVGVSLTKYGKWQAYAKLNQKRYHVGTFNTPEEASQARQDFLKAVDK